MKPNACYSSQWLCLSSCDLSKHSETFPLWCTVPCTPLLLADGPASFVRGLTTAVRLSSFCLANQASLWCGMSGTNRRASLHSCFGPNLRVAKRTVHTLGTRAILLWTHDDVIQILVLFWRWRNFQAMSTLRVTVSCTERSSMLLEMSCTV